MSIPSFSGQCSIRLSIASGEWMYVRVLAGNTRLFEMNLVKMYNLKR